MKFKFSRNYLLIALWCLCSCSKNKLQNEYSSFIGVYEWKSTGAQKGSLLNVTTKTFYQKEANYTATFALNDKGEAIFYKDGIEVSKNEYRVNDKETNAYDGKDILIKLKGSIGTMYIPDKTLKIHLSGDTTLTIDKFPFPGIDKMEDHLPEYKSMSSHFVRK